MTSKYLSEINEVGNKGTHDHHVVELEPSDSAFLRGRVKDQLFIDHLLMKDLISVEQHRRGEHLLQLAVSASVYLTSPKFTEVVGGGGGSNTNIYSSGLMRWHRAEKGIRKKWGDDGVVIIHDHVVLDVWTNEGEKVGFLSRILG
tara:strand:+ start:57 stop:491 length:435 start_codon:yes stop_codon:yes gene_type:complete